MGNEADEAEEVLEIAELVDARIDARMAEEFAKRPVKMEFKPVLTLPQAAPATVQIIKQESPAITMFAPSAVVKFEEAVLKGDPALLGALNRIADLLEKLLNRRPQEKTLEVTDQRGMTSTITVRPKG